MRKSLKFGLLTLALSLSACIPSNYSGKRTVVCNSGDIYTGYVSVKENKLYVEDGTRRVELWRDDCMLAKVARDG